MDSAFVHPDTAIASGFILSKALNIALSTRRSLTATA